MDAAIITALVAQAIVIAELARRILANGKALPLQEANPSPSEHHIGDMSVAYWLREFDRLTEGQAKAQKTLDAILAELRKS